MTRLAEWEAVLAAGHASSPTERTRRVNAQGVGLHHPDKLANLPEIIGIDPSLSHDTWTFLPGSPYTVQGFGPHEREEWPEDDFTEQDKAWAHPGRTYTRDARQMRTCGPCELLTDDDTCWACNAPLKAPEPWYRRGLPEWSTV